MEHERELEMEGIVPTEINLERLDAKLLILRRRAWERVKLPIDWLRVLVYGAVSTACLAFWVGFVSEISEWRFPWPSCRDRAASTCGRGCGQV